MKNAAVETFEDVFVTMDARADRESEIGIALSAEGDCAPRYLVYTRCSHALLLQACTAHAALQDKRPHLWQYTRLVLSREGPRARSTFKIHERADTVHGV